MKRLIVYLEHHLEGRIDRIKFDETVTLREVNDGKRNRPFVAVSRVVAVELIEDEPAAVEEAA
jgi:hypothetical protein